MADGATSAPPQPAPPAVAKPVVRPVVPASDVATMVGPTGSLPGTSADNVFGLQRMIGNAAVTALFARAAAPMAPDDGPSARSGRVAPRISATTIPRVRPVAGRVARRVDRTPRMGVITARPGLPERSPTRILRSGARDAVIQRHASAEHLALGNLPARDLGNVATAKDAIRSMGKAGIATQSVGEAIHLLAQERERVRYWQQNPPADIAAGADWNNVKLVEILPGVVATYGELNTLADYFGSLDDLKAMKPATVQKVLQTEREDFYGWLGAQLTELIKVDFVERQETKVVAGPHGGAQTITVNVKYFKKEGAYLNDDGGASAPYDTADQPGLEDQDFAGTQSGLTTNLSHPIEKVVSGVSKMHGADIPILTDPGTTSRGTGGAWGAIARNACHFVPESWYSWKKYHLEARQHARDAVNFQLAGNQAKAQAATNEAWLANGFGDHYLQDSFASGHLMNKTLIMQWFLEELKTWTFFGPTDTELARMSLVSQAHQPGLASEALYSKNTALTASGPQAASEKATAAGEFATAGLTRPNLLGGATALLRWWRTDVATGGSSTITLSDFKVINADVPAIASKEQLQQILNQLVSQGFVQIDKGFGILEPDYNLIEESPFLSTDKAESGNTNYDPASTMTLAAYHEFMNNATIQSGAGAMHDYFCKQGLVVSDDAGNNQFKIYGDNTLLEQGAARGVVLAGNAGAASRAAIDDILAGNGGAPSVDEIFARFPSKAVLPDTFDGQPVPRAGTELPLVQFLDALHGQMKPVWDKWAHWFAARIPLSHARSGLVDIQNISPHAGDEF